jgi:hypothetical protein
MAAVDQLETTGVTVNSDEAHPRRILPTIIVTEDPNANQILKMLRTTFKYTYIPLPSCATARTLVAFNM